MKPILLALPMPITTHRILLRPPELGDNAMADRNARPQMSTYAATKAAVKSLSESLRMANAKYGIRICNLAPAKILTPLLLTVNTSINDSQTISAEDLAKAALWIYQQPQTICIRDMVFAPTHYEP